MICCHLPHCDHLSPYLYSLIFSTSEGQVSCPALCIGTCVAVKEELSYMHFPREHSMRTGRKPRATDTRLGPPLLSPEFPTTRNRFLSIFSSIVCHRLFARKIPRNTVSGNQARHTTIWSYMTSSCFFVWWTAWPRDPGDTLLAREQTDVRR